MIEVPLKSRVELSAAGPEAAPMGRIAQRWSARPHRYAPGETHRGHSHVIDHVTFLEQGVISVRRNDREFPKQYAAPMWIEMPKDVWHEITALTEARWWCVFYDSREPGETAPFDAERA